MLVLFILLPCGNVLCYIRFMGRYSRFLRSLFFLVFVFYAVSPLSYTYNPKNAEDSLVIPEGAESCAGRFTILVWELIWTKLGTTGSEDHADSGVKILFRKARAILPDDVNKQAAAHAPISLHQALETRVCDGTIPAPSTDKKKPFRQFFSLFTGLSPPLA